jgi:hypothetical protein
MKMMKGMSINVSGCVVAHKTMNLSAPRFAGIKRLTVWIDSLSSSAGMRESADFLNLLIRYIALLQENLCCQTHQPD